MKSKQGSSSVGKQNVGRAPFVCSPGPSCSYTSCMKEVFRASRSNRRCRTSAFMAAWYLSLFLYHTRCSVPCALATCNAWNTYGHDPEMVGVFFQDYAQGIECQFAVSFSGGGLRVYTVPHVALHATYGGTEYQPLARLVQAGAATSCLRTH